MKSSKTKTAFISLIAGLLTNLVTALSQNGGTALNPEYVRAEIHAAKPDQVFGTYRDLCERVYRTRDMELISLCWEKPELSRELPQQMFADADPKFRARLVLMILRASPRTWFDKVDPFRDDGADGARGYRIEYCTETLKRYLPAQTLQQYPLNKKESRIQIAAAFEKVLSGEVATDPAPEVASPPSVAGTPAPATPVQSATPVTEAQPTTPPAQAPVATIEQRAPVWPWVVGILAIVVIVALVLKRRA